MDAEVAILVNRLMDFLKRNMISWEWMMNS